MAASRPELPLDSRPRCPRNPYSLQDVYTRCKLMLSQRCAVGVLQGRGRWRVQDGGLMCAPCAGALTPDAARVCDDWEWSVCQT